ncbi:MAG TPA: hypothetical protein VGD65_07425 [Chryseosolibacter sp.]
MERVIWKTQRYVLTSIVKMHKLFPIICFGLFACAPERARETTLGNTADSVSSIEFPILIDSGKKVVYQYSKMTPRGPQYFLDTVPSTDNLPITSMLDANFLFPLSLSDDERSNAPGIVAISIPGDFDETVIAIIDNDDNIRLRYKNRDIVLHSSNTVNFVPAFDYTFAKDTVHLNLVATLIETPTGTHRAGAGTLRIYEHNSLVQQCNIFIVGKK